MKRRACLVIFFSLMVFFCGCKKKEAAEPTAIWEAWTIIDTECGGFNSFAMDETGATYFHAIQTDEETYEMKQYLKKYDASGKEVYTKDYFEIFGASAGMDSVMDAENGVLYMLVSRPESAQKPAALSLLKYQQEMDCAELLHTFPAFSRVTRLIVSGDEVYLLGKEGGDSGNGGEDELSVMAYSLRNGEERMLGIPNPFDIARNKEGNLVFATKEADGINLFEYNPEEKKMRLLFNSPEDRFSSFALDEEGGIVYASKLEETVVWSNLEDITTGTEIYPWGLAGTRIFAKNGYVACRAENNRLVLINTTNISRETKKIRFLIRGNTVFQTPYSCGYKMERVEMAEDKIALKVLAMDKDYDICLLDSKNGYTSSVKERGNFYPLNELKGIDEYFAACFPYVKEAATKEDGSIWMLPIRVDIPLYVYDEAMRKDFSPQMTYEEFLEAAKGITQEERELTERLNLGLVFMNQYLDTNKSIDTEAFRKEFYRMKSVYDNMQGWAKGMDYQSEYQKGSYIIRNEFSSLVTNERGIYGPDAIVCGYPTISKGDSNLATCAFFVVNPKSDNLEETLRYLESYMKYMLNMEKAPSFFECKGVKLSRFDESMQNLYSRAKICFYLDSELINGYSECLEGEKNLEEYIRETEQKLKIYFNE